MTLAVAVLGCDSTLLPPERPDCASRAEAYPSDTQFSAISGADTTVLPECIPTCGKDSVDADGVLSIEALPAGACEGEAACDMGAYHPCGCDTAEGPVSGYRCSCENRTWRCVVISQGARPCPRCDGDAG